MEGQNARSDPISHQTGRPRSGRRVEVERGSGLVARRNHMYRRDLQECREDDFREGASLDDPSRLFNSSLEGNTRRAIDLREGDKIDERALKALIRAALTLNTSARTAARPVRTRKKLKSA